VNQLAEFLQSINPLPGSVLEDYFSHWKNIEFDRKEIITREGQTENFLYFVMEGIQRSYYEKEGKEFVIAFTYPPSFSGIPESFLTQTPSKYYLECLTPSKFLRITYEDHQKMMTQYREIETLFRKATERILAGIIERHYELMSYTIEERFLAFARRSPHLLNEIPHKYIASYLRIDSTNFSKLLNKLRID